MALDLRTTVPRSPFDELNGFPWLPRMIDKARAFFAGTHGEYSPYPCPGDRRFLSHFGLDADALGAVIKGGATDEEIGAWIATHAKGDATAFRASQSQPYPNPLYRLATWFFRRSMQKKLGASRPGVNWSSLHTFPMIIAAEEGHPVP